MTLSTILERVAMDGFAYSMMVDGVKEEQKPLSKIMMTMWTNFAKTGYVYMYAMCKFNGVFSLVYF